MRSTIKAGSLLASSSKKIHQHFTMFKALCLVAALFAVVYAVPSTYDTEHVWRAGNLSYVVPDNSIVGGFDPNGFTTYVGRVKNVNDILPARVVVESGTAYFNTETTSGKVLVYDILVSDRNLDYVWVRSYDGYYEKGLVAVGTTVKNERVYCCRARADGGLLVGTLLLSQKLCIIKHETLSLRKFDKYEVLIAQAKSNSTIY